MPRGGKRPGAGRPKGSRNKITVAVKEAVLRALDSGKGAEDFFLKLKNSKMPEDRRIFAQICAKLIPTEITGEGLQAPVINLVRFTQAVIPAPPQALPAQPLALPNGNNAPSE